MAKNRYTSVAEVAQAVGMNKYALTLLKYLDQYHPDKALDYEFIMQRADMAAAAAESYVRANGTTPAHQVAASDAANEVLMAGLESSKFDIIFSIADDILYEAGLRLDYDETKEIVLRVLPKFESVFAKYPIDDPNFAAEVEYDRMVEKLTEKAKKLLQPEVEKEKEKLPF